MEEQDMKQRKKLLKQFKRNQVRDVPSRKVVQDIWDELLSLKDSIETAKSKVESVDRSFGKLELYVRSLHRQTRREAKQLQEKAVK